LNLLSPSFFYLKICRSWMYGGWIYNYLCYQGQSPITFEFEPRSGEMYSIQYYVIKFVSDLRQVGGFQWFKIIGIVWISCHLHFNQKWYNIGLVWFMLFNVTFNNILVISWRSVLFVEVCPICLFVSAVCAM
jgi:hypothetical protein